ncbi:DUF309 domain-containing protein [Cohnella caldifontis]|uniref:DUF309 domain-containing protein n=1 Tax=Cohnella caldifontis TaxID=3027471 RepID=UPI0023EBFD68|nr:DUF309 domain-containing protein [Cohnella sp. YIM B05605]
MNVPDTAQSVPYPQSYLRYLAEYHGSRDYFECHEIMEEYWKEQTGSRYEGSWLVLIRVAVASYHARRGNWAGARKMIAKAADEIEPARMNELGLDGGRLAEMLRRAAREWAEGDSRTFRDLELPIADPALLRECRRICSENGWSWQPPVQDVPSEIVNRHLTRDRSGVVEARRQAAYRKKKGREKD